jgi:hypothetical protein
MARPNAMRFFIMIAALGLATTARGDEFPAALVRWKPLPGNPVFTGAKDGSWDQKIRERGYILRDRDGYRLWYTGYNDDRSPRKRLGLATSSDGLKWTRDRRNPLLATSWVEDVCVVRDGDGYVMFAEGQGDIAHQLTSRDGVEWHDEGRLDVRLANGRPIPPGPYGTPTALREAGRWYLFYERNDQGVWLAVSDDRKTFTNLRDEPVIACGPDACDSTAVALDQIVKRDGVYYGFYHANATRPWTDWTTCLARSRDLVHWEKYARNPILKDNCSSAMLVTAADGDRLYTMHPEVRVFVPDPGEK